MEKGSGWVEQSGGKATCEVVTVTLWVSGEENSGQTLLITRMITIAINLAKLASHGSSY